MHPSFYCFFFFFIDRKVFCQNSSVNKSVIVYKRLISAFAIVVGRYKVTFDTNQLEKGEEQEEKVLDKERL